MASEVDICNLALAHLGDEATVASINPPEGSAQAEQCQRFYPIARDQLLELHNWNFATRRAILPSVTNTARQWRYAYAAPADMMKAVSVIPLDAEDDYSTNLYPTDNPAWGNIYSPVIAAGTYVPQAYSMEIDANGNYVIYTNLENAMLRYQAKITDPSRFTPLFTITLSWSLASMLAGPVLKGDAGQAESKRCNQIMGAYLLQATSSDANQRNVKPEHIVSWMAGR